MDGPYQVWVQEDGYSLENGTRGSLQPVFFHILLPLFQPAHPLFPCPWGHFHFCIEPIGFCLIPRLGCSLLRHGRLWLHLLDCLRLLCRPLYARIRFTLAAQAMKSSNVKTCHVMSSLCGFAVMFKKTADINKVEKYSLTTHENLYTSAGLPMMSSHGDLLKT